MMLTRKWIRTVLTPKVLLQGILAKGILATAALGAVAGQAARADEIRIGEINSYSALPAFTEPYRKGWQLAVEEINAAGGIGGKTLVVVSRDDGGKPADAVTAANELVSKDGVALIAGTFFSNIGLAVSDFAAQKKILFMAAEPLTDAITWSKGNRYTFRLRPSNYMQAAMLAEEAAKLPAKRWATIAPNYEYGQSAVAVFKQLLSAKRPDIEWVGEQWPPQGKIEAALVKASGPDGDRIRKARPGEQKEAMHATTHYSVIDRVAHKASWVSLKPVTGRQHQLRAHMEMIGHPIVGDNKYDGGMDLVAENIEPKLHLHARRLIIPHPAGKAKIDVSAPLPPHMLVTWDLLGLDPRRFDKDDG